MHFIWNALVENLDLVFESQISKKKSGFYSRDRFQLRNWNLDYMDFLFHFWIFFFNILLLLCLGSIQKKRTCKPILASSDRLVFSAYTVAGVLVWLWWITKIHSKIPPPSSYHFSYNFDDGFCVFGVKTFSISIKEWQEHKECLVESIHLLYILEWTSKRLFKG